MAFTHIASLSHRRRILGGGYVDQILGLGPLAYWPLSEASGSVAACLVNAAQNGTYTGVTLANEACGPFGSSAPYFDGSNDYVDVYSATLRDAWNTNERSMMIWAKVANAGVWTDATNRAAIDLRGTSVTDNMLMRKDNGNDQFDWFYRSSLGGVQLTRTETPVSETGWMCLALTASVANDQMIAYRDGAQIGAALTGVNAWGTLLGSTDACLGAANTAPSTNWHGWLAHAVLWNRILAPAEVAALATP